MSGLLGVLIRRYWLKLRIPTGQRVVIFVVLVGVEAVVGILSVSVVFTIKLSVLWGGGFQGKVISSR